MNDDIRVCIRNKHVTESVTNKQTTVIVTTRKLPALYVIRHMFNEKASLAESGKGRLIGRRIATPAFRETHTIPDRPSHCKGKPTLALRLHEAFNRF
jgi:hypothetical protein